MSLTADRLRELVIYNHDSGNFTWNAKRRRCSPGKQAGCKMRNGYIIIRIDNILYLAHRLAWLYVFGVFPRMQIDHINGVRDDNKLSNLREASNMENAQNRRKGNNKSGFTGVYKENNKWRAEIKINYKNIRIGLFETPEEAHVAYIDYKRRFHKFSTV